ncbi:hypothetical protein D3C78_1295380 [compost metagenome]
MGLKKNRIFAVERNFTALRMGKRCFEECFQAVSGTNGLRFGMIKRAQIAQRLEKFGCQNEREETGRQRHCRAVVTKIERAEIRETEVNGYQGNRKRSKEFKYAR